MNWESTRRASASTVDRSEPTNVLGSFSAVADWSHSPAETVTRCPEAWRLNSEVCSHSLRWDSVLLETTRRAFICSAYKSKISKHVSLSIQQQ